MNAGVHHQSDGAPHFVGQLAKPGVVVLVQAQFLAQFLAVQAPAFNEGRVAAVATKVGNIFQLHGQGNLKVMAGHRFVQRQRFDLIFWTILRAIQIDKIAAWPGAVGRWLLIVGRGRIGRHLGGNRYDLVGGFGQAMKQSRQFRIDAATAGAIGGQQVVGVFIVELGGRSQVREELLKRALKADPLLNGLHLLTNATDFGQADVVDLLRREAGGREFPRQHGIHLPSVRSLPAAHLVERRRDVFFCKEREKSLIGGDDLLPDDASGRLLQACLFGVRQFNVERPKRIVVQAVCWLGDNLLANLRGDSLHDHFGMQHSGLHSFLHQHHGLVNLSGQRLQAFQPVFIVSDGVKPQ